MTTPYWRIIESRGRRGLEDLEADWRRLYARMPLRTSFLSYEACLAHVDTYMQDPDELRCLALTDGRQVRGICLLEPSITGMLDFEGKCRALLRLPPRDLSARRSRRGGRRSGLHQVWGVLWQWHSRQADVLCADDEARRAFIPLLAAHLRRAPEGRPLLVVGPAPADSALWDGFRRLPRHSYHLERRESVNSLPCTRPFDEVKASLPRRFRQDLNRASRRLAQLQDVHLQTYTAADGLDTVLDDFLAVEASGWKGASGAKSAIVCDARSLAFVRALTRDLRHPDDSCEIDALYAEGRCIAASLGTRTGATYSALKIGYDEAYRRVSPGQIVVEHAVERCCADPAIERLDMVSDASWVRGWRPDLIPLQIGYVVIARWPAYALVAGLLRLRVGLGRRIAGRLRVTAQPPGEQAP